MIPILSFFLILAGTVLLMFSYWPTSIAVDRDNNINLRVKLGGGRKIPIDEITISEVPKGFLSHCIRTNGMSLGKIQYGRFRNTTTGQKMFLYLTGKEHRVCFEYEGVLYVVDDWRKDADKDGGKTAGKTVEQGKTS